MALRSGDPLWPRPSGPAATAVMRANRWHDTQPETALRSELHRRGLRFRKRHTIRLDGRRWTQPDVVFTRARVAVFVDGCFWHRCPEHGTSPKANAGYWNPKLDHNVARDRDTDRQLGERGWLVVRAWEHEVPADVADRVQTAVRARTATV
jgi:DNA mismatch endonuclease (patch repair protein)